jgi:hypothetical protein
MMLLKHMRLLNAYVKGRKLSEENQVLTRASKSNARSIIIETVFCFFALAIISRRTVQKRSHGAFNRIFTNGCSRIVIAVIRADCNTLLGYVAPLRAAGRAGMALTGSTRCRRIIPA